MRSKQEEIFFYRDRQFQEQSQAVWGMDLFVENTQTPERFVSFWDNIHTLKSNKNREQYAQEQCDILNNIQIKDMVIDFKPNDGLYIKDRTEPDDVFAIIDFRDSSHGELRGKDLANALKEYANTHQEGTVYEALNSLLHSHFNPTFKQFAKMCGLLEQAQIVAFKAIDVVLGWGNKLKPATEYSQVWIENNKLINELFPKFLAVLDKENINSLQQRLAGKEFEDELYSDTRNDAIQKLLAYRQTLFVETDTLGINLKDNRKASKCHFSEQMINALVTNKPEAGQSYKDYIEACINKAEEKLTPEEVKDWPKGVFSHRLRDIVTHIKEVEPDADQLQHRI